jgi:hypothetical protein
LLLLAAILESMLNAGLKLLERGFEMRLKHFGEELQILPSGPKFRGIIEPAPPIDPVLFELGSDLREKSILHVRQEDDPGIELFDRLSPTAPAEDPTDEEPATKEPDGDEVPTVWKVIKREANPGDFTNKFWIVNVVPGKDQ